MVFPNYLESSSQSSWTSAQLTSSQNADYKFQNIIKFQNFQESDVIKQLQTFVSVNMSFYWPAKPILTSAFGQYYFTGQ